MITSRDYVIRQIRQLTLALATLLGKRGALSASEVAAEISATMQGAAGVDLERLRRLTRAEVRALCERDGAVNPELAVSMADLLAHDEHEASRLRAAWLYEEALRAGGPVPHDIHDRILRLSGDQAAAASSKNPAASTESPAEPG